MSKTLSQSLKGIAILLMVYLHLFDGLDNVELCKNFIYIDSIPLTYLISKACNPVAFFLILGGYGLYKVWQKGDSNRWWRIIRLMVHYWIILLLFLFIGHILKPEAYPRSVTAFISNLTGYDTSYNAEMWFLLPYIILSVLAPSIFRICRNLKWIWIVGTTFGLYCIAHICIVKFGTLFLYDNMWAYNPLLVILLSFNFCLGYLAARENWFEKLKGSIAGHSANLVNMLAVLGIILLAAIQIVFKYNILYEFSVILLISVMTIPRPVETVLVKLGNQSMNMWMIHTWYCYYLFHNFIYSFRYPILIFIVLTLLSYFSSLLINVIATPIERLFLTRKEMRQKPVL